MKIGTTELLIVLVVVVILFGPTQLPKLSRMFGKTLKSFRSGMSDDEDDAKSSGKEKTDTAEQ